MSTFHERKAERKEYYENWVKGWKLRPCSACNGSGYYDHNGSPDCGACDGTGKERYNPIKDEQDMLRYMEEDLESWQLRFWNEYIETPRGKEYLQTEAGIKMQNKVNSLKKRKGSF